MCKIMANHLFVSVVLVLNILMGSCLRSSAREKKAKCPTCSDITEAFKKGIENTEKANFGGGNTDWEERKLGSFATSETRLVEIMEGLCDESAIECHAMVEEQEESLEDWWFKHQFEVNDMKTWLCVDKMKVCCPNGTFGQECSECVGGKENPCNGHGKCEGEGTREGSGHCTCDSGYEGELCDDCADGYFEEQGEDSKPKCTACHISCEDGCNGSSPKDCEKCKDGWEWNEEEGCTDKNECEEEEKCEGGNYCMNNPGSYSCQACHDSCEGNCRGEGPKGCVECTSGYAMTDEEGCKDVDECAANATICESGKFCDNTPGSYVCQECHSACQTCIGEGSQGCTKCRLGYRMVDSDCKDVDECALDKHLCDKGTQRCINTVGSFSCECKKGFKREGATCVKKKGKNKKQRTEKAQEHQLEEDLRKGNYFTEFQMKIGAVLYALFFACVIAAVMRRSRIGLIILSAGYACFLWYLRR